MFNTDFKSIAPINAKVAQKATLNRQEEIKYEKLSECFQEIRKATNKGEFTAKVWIPEFIYNFITSKLIEYGYIYTFAPSLKENLSVILYINWEKPRED